MPIIRVIVAAPDGDASSIEYAIRRGQAHPISIHPEGKYLPICGRWRGARRAMKGARGNDIRATMGLAAAAPLDRHASTSLFDSSHQHRVFTVVRAIESRQRLPAFRRESRNVGVSNIVEYFRARCGGYGRYAIRYAKPLAISLLLACLRAEPRCRSLWLVGFAALLADVPRCHGMRAVGSLIETGMVVA